MIGSEHRGLKLWLKSLFGDPEKISAELLEPISIRMYNMQINLNSLDESDLLNKALAEGEASRRVLLIPGAAGQEQRMFVEVS